MNPITIIKTGEEHQQALARISALMDSDPAPDSPEANQLELLALVIEHYEQKHYPIDPPDPIEAIRFSMDQMDLSRKDLARYIGSPSKVSEVLSGKRPLSLNMIRRLNAGLGISADVLIRESA
ncbi:MAG: HTH-type transcriptional regulator / antitoxin HigA [Candidatus Kentron sp. G]|nr:MAG: HTH-type transcriptional regulator / antitoxin HigA [Candidatus Kentron sp. G]VFN01579.1 MAG: HTH-type transcriptional regulator / antitoxin HigA [Candidatus Kentron sp. G]VFN03204.1 MAG: HTH-type transcriptional regulator / antitoxin HigA [Candidatus Kentron sp. G]